MFIKKIKVHVHEVYQFSGCNLCEQSQYTVTIIANSKQSSTTHLNARMINIKLNDYNKIEIFVASRKIE